MTATRTNYADPGEGSISHDEVEVNDELRGHHFFFFFFHHFQKPTIFWGHPPEKLHAEIEKNYDLATGSNKFHSE